MTTDTTTATPKPSAPRRLELTLRALILGAILAVVFTAANTYLGLLVGLTFASAIPAAVISMALLRAVKTSTIWENMTVQTVASVGGSMSAIIFVLPALVMIGWWMEFPFWQSVAICILGGVLGVTFSIPLRRSLVVQGDLPYPEGRAAAEVLKVGSPGEDQSESAVRENKQGLWVVIGGALAAAVFSWLAKARILIEGVGLFFRIPTPFGVGVTGLGFGLNFALIGAGHLIGLAVGMAQLVGLIIAWGVAVPIMTALQATPGEAEAAATMVWAEQVRFIGAGVIGVAALWTLFKLARPLVSGLTSALAAQSRRSHGEVMERSEFDIPISIVGALSLACLVGIAVLFWSFAQGTVLAASAPLMVAGGLVYVVVIGFAVAAICGYMAGLIGSSNSPVSGVGILAIVIAALLMLGLMALTGVPADPSIIAFALIVTAVVFAVAIIANDNLQDLKTGQLVDATPWRQQTALIVGVVAGALIIPFVLDLLNQAYGFVGGPPAVVEGAKPLPAPQATLIAGLAKGVIEGGLRWDLIGIGGLIGAAIIAVDEALRRVSAERFKLPPLAAGIGVYLPASVTAMLVVGALAGAGYNRWVSGTRFAAAGRRMGVLLASGLIVGESLFGVFTAGMVVGTGTGEPFALLPDGSTWPAALVGVIAFIALTLALYAWTRSRAAKV